MAIRKTEMKTKLAIIALAAFITTGCQNPGIVQVSPNTYMLSREDHAASLGARAR
jgi:uncharacterized lipoprotein YajG